MKMPKFLHCKIKRYLTLAGSREYNCTSIHNTIFGFHSTPQILNIEASGQINISMPPLNDSSRNHRKIGDGVLTQVLIKTKPSSLPDRSDQFAYSHSKPSMSKKGHYTTLPSIQVRPPATTGKQKIAVCQNVCRALFIGRTANVDFAVRFPDDARQTKTHGIYILCRVFS
jgi:hypothetical protein